MREKDQDSASKLKDGMVHSILDGVAVMNADLTIKSYVLDQIQATVTVTDLDGNIIYVNLEEKEMLGYSNEDFIGASTQIFGEDKKKGASQQEILEKTLRYGKWKGEVSNKTVDGQEVLFETRTQVIYNDQGDRVALAGVSVDITERKELEKRIVAEKELFKTTLLSVCDGVISIDAEGKVLILNPIAEQLTGWTLKEAVGRPIDEVFHIMNALTKEKCENPAQRVFKTGTVIESTDNSLLISKDGIERPIEDSAAPIKDEQGNITGVVLVFRDFTEKKKQRDEITYLSYRDHLTGIYNRRFFEMELVRLDTKRNLPMTIIMGDVNGLKLINDAFGHAVGDELLIKTAEILKKSFRADDIIARVGGDEYAILLPKTEGSEAEELINRMMRSLKKEKVRDLDVSISFGLATKTNMSESTDVMIKMAEDHMYNNKLFEGPSVRGRMIDNILTTINEKSTKEKAHSERVSYLCGAIGEALKLEDVEIKMLKAFGMLHDIGKITIADVILNKADGLTEKEYNEVKRHSEIGFRILNVVSDMSELADYVLYHHERWDGTGYPKGLVGDFIPLPSRICAIADAYDAMTSERSYRPAMTHELAVEELQKNSGTQFDPDLISIFLKKVIPKLKL